MTDDEAIAEVKAGGRVGGRFSLHDARKPIPCGVHTWRVLFCNDDEDVNECQNCGEQAVHACDFNTDFA